MAGAISMPIKEGASRAELKKEFNLENALKKWEKLLNKALKEKFAAEENIEATNRLER